MNPACDQRTGLWAVFSFLLLMVVNAQSQISQAYDIGAPTLTDIWVDHNHGQDSHNGATRAQALATITEAWNRIPIGTLSGTGYRIQIVAGDYAESIVPSYWERRHGTWQCPIILNAADGRGSVTLPNLNIFDCRYFYLLDLHIKAHGGDALHFEQCTHMLVRNSIIEGVGNVDNYEGPQEAFKANQCQHVYVEECDISGGWDNAIDFVAVQYGHIIANRIHRAHEWCMYLKGGSAYFNIEANELYNTDSGGFSAGQGTGFEYMVSPWLHYEAYDCKFINNLVHDMEGPGMGVNGGYNILLAHNTLYRVGRRSHGLEVVFGSRSCDGDTVRCRQNLLQGGWGTDVPGNAESIPSKNVYIYNNLLLNPDGYASAWQHFAIHGPRTAPAESNIPSPVRCDINVQIRGNLIWNGAADLSLGIEGEDQGCQAGNPSCFTEQLLRDNTINTVRPALIDPDANNFHPAAGSAVFSSRTYAIPEFPGNDRPKPPEAPMGVLENHVARDFDGALRNDAGPPGAYMSISSRVTGIAGQPAKLRLTQNYPNPFNPQTQIDYELSAALNIELAIFNLAGQKVRTLVDDDQAKGFHSVCWDGMGEQGAKMASGIYIYQLQSGDFIIARKLILMR